MNLAGRWKGQLIDPDGSIEELSLEFEVKGEDVDGWEDSVVGDRQPLHGSIEGEKCHFCFSSRQETVERTCDNVYSGKIKSDGSLQGNWLGIGGLNGRFRFWRI